jgi:exodeoxyribonuclease V alpha subunit
VFDTIEQAPARLQEVAGIGPVRAGRIVAGWAEQKVVREIMLFLHSHGVGTSRAVRIYKTYGADAVQVISANPDRLARDIRGIGFKTADQIAQRLGIEKTAMIRARAGIGHALAEAMDEGHCGLPTNELIGLAAELLEIPPLLVEAALELELADGAVVADAVAGRACVFLAGLHRAERAVAERLLALAAGEPPWGGGLDADKALPWAEQKVGLSLAPSQQAAVRLALCSKLLVITGGPGVGKTRLSRALPRSWGPRPLPCSWRHLPGVPPSGWARPRAWRPKPCTACWKRIRPRAGSSGARRARSSATCWWWTRSRWWMCRSCTLC